MSTILKEFKKEDSQGAKRTFVEFDCDNCSCVSCRPKKEFKDNSNNFCSQKCWRDFQAKDCSVELNCNFCNKLFQKRKSHLQNSKSGLYFCSKSCKDKAQRLDSGFPQIHPAHYGNGIDSYREIAFRIYDKICSSCGYNKHPEVLEVHHKDRNRENNNSSNLEVLCPTCHREEHFLSKDGSFSGKNK